MIRERSSRHPSVRECLLSPRGLAAARVVHPGATEGPSGVPGRLLATRRFRVANSVSSCNSRTPLQTSLSAFVTIRSAGIDAVSCTENPLSSSMSTSASLLLQARPSAHASVRDFPLGSSRATVCFEDEAAFGEFDASVRSSRSTRQLRAAGQ